MVVAIPLKAPVTSTAVPSRATAGGRVRREGGSHPASAPATRCRLSREAGKFKLARGLGCAASPLPGRRDDGGVRVHRVEQSSSRGKSMRTSDPVLELRAGPPRARCSACWSARPADGPARQRGSAAKLRRSAVIAGVRRRFAPHQLRHAHAVGMSREGVPLVIIQRQLGHADLGISRRRDHNLRGAVSANAIVREPPPTPAPERETPAPLHGKRMCDLGVGS